jgi:protein-tyrosine phosphatase
MRRFIRRKSDNLLGPRRRRSASENLRRIGPPQRVLVICYGNVCRSPYLEAVLARRLLQTAVVSAGFVGPGRGVPEHSQSLAALRGLDLRNHRSQLITPALAKSADLVIVMDTPQARAMARRFGVAEERILQIGDLDPEAGAGRTIADPWGKSRTEFESCFNRLDRCAAELVRVVYSGG